jgi:hypothetical protein
MPTFHMPVVPASTDSAGTTCTTIGTTSTASLATATPCASALTGLSLTEWPGQEYVTELKRRADCLFLQLGPADAIPLYSTAIAIHDACSIPSRAVSASLLLNRAAALVRVGRHTDAVNDAARAAALCPSDPFPLYRLSEAYFFACDFAAAMNAAETGLQLYEASRRSPELRTQVASATCVESDNHMAASLLRDAAHQCNRYMLAFKRGLPIDVDELASDHTDEDSAVATDGEDTSMPDPNRNVIVPLAPGVRWLFDLDDCEIDPQQVRRENSARGDAFHNSTLVRGDLDDCATVPATQPQPNGMSASTHRQRSFPKTTLCSCFAARRKTSGKR